MTFLSNSLSRSRASFNRIARQAPKRPASGKRMHRAIEAELLELRRMLAAHVVGSTAVYSTIQAAVNAAAPGGTVTVDAGTYPELVAIGKSLTVLGAESGIDARG